jgi:hypothetical protein
LRNFDKESKRQKKLGQLRDAGNLVAESLTRERELSDRLSWEIQGPKSKEN